MSFPVCTPSSSLSWIPRCSNRNMADPIRLALVGYGKMGRLIEQLASEYDAVVVLRLTGAENPNGSGITAQAFADVDVAVEFSTPKAAPASLVRLAEAHVPT